jgi:aerobic carbon-monoxide dehydrogenase small subunit
VKLELSINGAAYAVEASPWRRLLDVLRYDLALTGTKEGCGEGECGACTVLLDGEPVNSCLVTASQCSGRQLVTVEGLAVQGAGGVSEAGGDAGAGSAAGGAGGVSGVGGELLHAVQRQLVACGGAQCGICTPGIAVCAKYVVDGDLLAGASDEQARARVRELLAGNICRCTGYQLIVEAVVAAAREVTGAASPAGSASAASSAGGGAQ